MRPGGARKRRDASEPAIIAVFKAAGWSVQQLHIPGGPDLLLGAHGTAHLAEVKSGKAKLREGQDTWHQRWRGSPVRVLRTPEDALAWVRETTRCSGLSG